MFEYVGHFIASLCFGLVLSFIEVFIGTRKVFVILTAFVSLYFFAALIDSNFRNLFLAQFVEWPLLLIGFIGVVVGSVIGKEVGQQWKWKRK